MILVLVRLYGTVVDIRSEVWLGTHCEKTHRGAHTCKQTLKLYGKTKQLTIMSHLNTE